MSKHEYLNDRLDTEFDHFLLDMKPYVLKNPSKTGKVGFTVFLRVMIVIVHLLHRWVGRGFVAQSKNTKWMIEYGRFCFEGRPNFCFSIFTRTPPMCHMDKETV